MKPPIEQQEYMHGVNVVDIGDLRVARGKTRRHAPTCTHLRLIYDDTERRVWCKDCESEVEPFDAFKGLVVHFDGHIKALERRAQAVKEAESHTLISRATKIMDQVWRSTKLAPLCPHCSVPILPDDVVRGVATASKSLVIAARKRSKDDRA